MAGTRNPVEAPALVAGIAVALAVGGALFYVRFCGSPEIPDRPARPSLMQIQAEQAAAKLDASRQIFAQRLADDSSRYRVRPATTIEDLEKPFDYKVSKRRVSLEPGGDPIELAGLRISAIRKQRQLALRIENTMDSPAAYRVETRPERGLRACRGKDDLTHNALALREKGHKDGTVERSECSYRRGKGVIVTEVETIELPLLSYYYVSRLLPPSVGLTGIAVNGHRPAEGRPCNRTVSAALERRLQQGQTGWRDLIDFYARHSCEIYRFPSDYEALKDIGAIRLPAVEGG